MNVHFGLYHLDLAAWNGHAQMMRFLSDGLKAAGHRITATHSTTTAHGTRYHFSQLCDTTGWSDLSTYESTSSSRQQASSEWNQGLVDWAGNLLTSHDVNVVYAQGAGDILDIVRAGTMCGRRCVYHVHDFDLLCGRRYLLDHAGNPCSGPTTTAKCDTCLRQRYAWHARAAAYCASMPQFMGSLPPPVRSVLRRYAYHEAVEKAAARREATVATVDCFVSTGETVSRVLIEAGVPSARIHVLPHIITRPEMRESPPSTQRNPGPVRIGYFGRLGSEKGVALLARVLNLLRREGQFAFEWWVICNGETKAAHALKRISGLSDDSFKHVQCSNATALRDALRQLDLAVFPSRWPEVGPLALLEALQQGVFCIASDNLAMASAIKAGNSGFLFDSGQADSLARSIRAAIRHPYVLGDRRRNSFLDPPDDRLYFATLRDILAPRNQRQSLSTNSA